MRQKEAEIEAIHQTTVEQDMLLFEKFKQVWRESGMTKEVIDFYENDFKMFLEVQEIVFKLHRDGKFVMIQELKNRIPDNLWLNFIIRLGEHLGVNKPENDNFVSREAYHRFRDEIKSRARAIITRSDIN